VSAKAEQLSDSKPLQPEGRLAHILAPILGARPDETIPALLAALYFFFLMTSYFIFRPIRDELAVADGVSRLPWLFAGTLGATLVCNPVLSALVVRFRVKYFIAITYQFFALNLVVFYLLTHQSTGLWIGRIFFVWTSVFNLFATSLFWAFMADTFRNQQAKRVFGFIGLGGTVGSILGSGTTAILARRLGSHNLLLVSAALLQIVLAIVWFFPRRGPSTAEADDPVNKPIGGSVWAGLLHLSRSTYLSGIATFTLLFALGSTVLYAVQTDVVGKYLASRELRTAFLAKIEFGSQLLTAITQTFLTARVIRWIGLAATLAVMPAISVLGFALMGSSAFGIPLLATLVAFTIARRGLNFALTKPSQEILFTVVSREDKFKAKPLIDTFIYRAADQLGAWGYVALLGVGLTVGGIAWIAVATSLAHLGIGLWLGKKEGQLAGITPTTPTLSASLPNS
jgi:AAA family ATP:ADP antiporter